MSSVSRSRFAPSCKIEFFPSDTSHYNFLGAWQRVLSTPQRFESNLRSCARLNAQVPYGERRRTINQSKSIVPIVCFGIRAEHIRAKAAYAAANRHSCRLTDKSLFKRDIWIEKRKRMKLFPQARILINLKTKNWISRSIVRKREIHTECVFGMLGCFSNRQSLSIIARRLPNCCVEETRFALIANGDSQWREFLLVYFKRERARVTDNVYYTFRWPSRNSPSDCLYQLDLRLREAIYNLNLAAGA